MTELSRRGLLGASALGVGVALFGSPSSAVAAAPSARLYTRTRFTPQLRKVFKLTSATGSWSMRLTQVTDLPGARRGAKHCFGLTFRSSVAGPPQGTCTLRRPGFTSMTLFIVPSDASRRTYQAVVNRMPGA